MSLYRRTPRRIGGALGELTRIWEPDTVLAEVQRIWSATVGDVIAAEAQPVGEHAGIVSIACSGSVWAQELDLLAPDIVNTLNRHLRGGRIRRLRCSAAR
ncbi:MAG: DciA family protein [Solirubrobacteraceae bacterium]